MLALGVVAGTAGLVIGGQATLLVSLSLLAAGLSALYLWRGRATGGRVTSAPSQAQTVAPTAATCPGSQEHPC